MRNLTSLCHDMEKKNELDLAKGSTVTNSNLMGELFHLVTDDKPLSEVIIDAINARLEKI